MPRVSSDEDATDEQSSEDDGTEEQASNDDVSQEESDEENNEWPNHKQFSMANRMETNLDARRRALSELTELESHLNKEVLHIDGNINVSVVLQNYLVLNRTDTLLTNGALKVLMERYPNPCCRNVVSRSPRHFNFCSYLWDEILKTQFLPHKPTTRLMRNVRDTFTEEMLHYHPSEMDLGTFSRYVERLQSTHLYYVRVDNFFELPAILRILAPPFKSVVASDNDGKLVYMKNCLKALPHTIIMKIWNEFFKEGDILPRLKNAREVSSSFVRFLQLLLH